MVAVAKTNMTISNVIENELYRCVIDLEEKTVTVTTDLGPDVARRVAEFEAGKTSVNISLIFNVAEQTTHRAYMFRLRYGGCLADDGTNETGEDQYKELAVRKEGISPGCPHSKKGSPKTCSQCIAYRERLELIALVKAGKV